MAFNPDEFLKNYKPVEAAPFDPDEFLKTNTRKLTPFTGSAAQSIEKLKGDISALAGKAGLKDIAQAEADKKRNDEIAAGLYAPTTEGWMEAPGTKLAELAGGSLPYVAAPAVAAGLASAALPGSVGLLGAASLAGTGTSALQFAGSNLSRQMDTGKSLDETSLTNAALAAVPQALFERISFGMIPGVRQIFGSTGTKLTEEAALELAQRSIAKKAADFSLKTGKLMTAEGLTETAQQVLERMQAGLSITDPQARQEYLDSFIGGAVLSGAASIPGSMYEAMGQAKKEEPPEAVPPVTPAQPQLGGPQAGPEANAGYSQAGTPPPGGPTGEPPLYKVPTPPELPAPNQPGLPPPPRALTSTPEPTVPSTEGLAPIPFQTVKYDTGAPGNKRYEEGQAPIIDYSGRKIVMHNVNGVQVPFYLSTGTGGKTDVPAGKWYPFFGIGSDGWINKTGGQEMANYYGSDALRQAGEQLDTSIGDIRNDNKIPKVSSTGAHIDFINQGFTPTANQTKDTITNVRQNIDNTLARINEQNVSVTPVTVSENTQQNQATNNLPEGFEHFEEVQPDGTVKAGVRRIEEKKTLTKRPNDPALETEARSIADQIEQAGDPKLADVIRSSIDKMGGLTDTKKIDFWKQKLTDIQQQANTIPERPQETWDMEKIHKEGGGAKQEDLRRVVKFLPTAPQEVQDQIAKSNQYLQEIADKINEAGYKLTDVKSTAPSEVQDLRTKFSQISGSTTRYLKDAEHIARNNRYANPESLAKTKILLDQDYTDADRMLGRTQDTATEWNDLVGSLTGYSNVPNAKFEDLSPTLQEKITATQKQDGRLHSRNIGQFIPEIEQHLVDKKAATREANRQRQEEQRKRTEEKANAAANADAILAERLKKHKETLSAWLPDFGWATEGGKIIRDPETGEVVGRTTWEAKNEYLDSVRDSLGRSFNEIKKSVELAIAGKPLTPKQHTDVNAVMDLFEELEQQFATELTEDEINELFQIAGYEENEAYIENTIYSAPTEEDFAEERPQAEALELKGETKEEIAAKEKAAAIEANLKRQAEQKAKAQEAAGEFTLTGSNREADIAAAKGAQDLFAAPAQQSTTPTEESKDKGKLSVREPKQWEKDTYDALQVLSFGNWDYIFTARNDIEVSPRDGKRFDKIVQEENFWTIRNNGDKRGGNIYEGSSNWPDFIPKNAIPLLNEWTNARTSNQKRNEIYPEIYQAFKDAESSSVKNEEVKAEIAVGDQVWIAKNTLDGQVPAVARVTKVMNGNNFEVRLTTGGYLIVNKSELSLTKEGLGLAPIKSTAPKKELVSEDGIKITSPVYVGLHENGFKMLDIKDPRTYKDGAGSPYRTFEKNGVRIALAGDEVLYIHNGHVNRARGEEKETTIHFIGVDVGMRKTGAAKEALQTLADVADKNNIELYVEPTQLDKTGLDRDQLIALYKKFGFEDSIYYDREDGQQKTDKVLVRKPGAKAKEAPVTPEVDEEAAYEALQKQAEEDVDAGPIGQALARIENGDFETKAQIKRFVNKLERDGIIEDPSDIYESLSDREQYAEDVIEDVRSALDDVRDDAVQERVDELESENNTLQSNRIQGMTDQEIIEETLGQRIKQYRKEAIALLSGVNKRIKNLTKKIADVGSDIPTQKKLNELLGFSNEISEYLKATQPKNNTAAFFMAKAHEEYAKKRISKDVLDVIESINKKYPGILEGLKLSVWEGKDKTIGGNFNPIKKIVTLFTGTYGAQKAFAIRHEITHSLEQMMTPAARKAVNDAWAKAFIKAEAKYTDARSQEYFKKVREYLKNPNQKTFKAATDAMPSNDLYQYINASEYWAENAEELFGAKLGTPWNRFTNAVKKIFEYLKSKFGFDNNYVVHRELDSILSGDLKRKTDSMVSDYIQKTGVQTAFLNSVRKDEDLMNDYGIPETPSHESESVKEMLAGKFSKMKAKYAQFKNQPKDEANNLFKAAGDTALSARIKAVYFGAGLESEEFKRYNGKIRNAFGEILPSVILKNAMKASYIYAEVIKLGHMQYDTIHENFMAKANKYSMGNVLRLQHELRQKLGTALADKVINSYHAAKRARSMQNSYLDAMKNVQQLTDDIKATTDLDLKDKLKIQLEDAKKYLQSIRRAFIQVPNYLCAIDPVNPTVVVNGKRVKNIMFDRDDMPILNDEAVDRLIAQEKDHPQLAEILKNFTSVNHNMLDMMAFSGRISKGMVEKLKAIKDYSPFTRVVDDPITELFGERNVGVNTAGIKHFKLTRTERELDNVVDSMMHNVGTMIRSATKTYAQVKIAREFATRRPDEKDPKTGKVTRGKIRVYPTEGKTDNAVYFPIYANGKKVVVEIPNRNVGEAMIGLAMGPMEYEFQKVLAGFANFTRRSITFTGYFQAKQVFYDAPSAALVSGVKDPFRLWAGCFSSFANSVSNIVTDQPDSATIQILKSAGVGGFQGYFRETSAEFKTRMGIFSGSNYSKAMELIDKIGDASDFSQREATYNRVLKESGDPALALLQANDIIDFSRHGTSKFAQGMRQTIPFMQAFATQMDAITQAAQGKNLKGKAREDAQKQFAKTALMLAGVTLAYVAMCAADDDYFELDDDTRARNFYIPFSKKTFGYPVLIPMHSTSSLFWKVMPEMLIHKMITDGTKNEMDGTRLWKAFTNAFADSMLGPTPVPSLIKPPIEITLNRNFYTGNTLTPRGMENLIAEEKYTAKTSELGKFLSAATGRILNPIEADHLGNGWAGSVYSLTAWASNAIFGENRVANAPSENPFLAGFVGQEVSRKNESLFYGLKDKTEPAYGTYMAKLAKGNEAETIAFYNKNKDLIQAHEYVSAVEQDLKAINKIIKDIGKSEAQDENGKVYTPEKKLELITQYKEMKSQLLNNVIAFRKQAGL